VSEYLERLLPWPIPLRPICRSVQAYSTSKLSKKTMYPRPLESWQPYEIWKEMEKKKTKEKSGRKRAEIQGAITEPVRKVHSISIKYN